MRDHATIVRTVGAVAMARLLERDGVEISPSAPQKWADRDSIPAEYWAALARLGVATLAELADAAARSRPGVAA